MSNRRQQIISWDDLPSLNSKVNKGGQVVYLNATFYIRSTCVYVGNEISKYVHIT